MALTAKRQVEEKEGVLRQYAVVADDIIYQGALCKINAAGYLAPCAAEAGAIFAGICESGADNTGGAAGDKNAVVKKKGVFKLPISDALTIANIGDVVYATDDADCTITEAANLQIVGRIVGFIDANYAWVELMHEGVVLGS